MPLIWEVLKSEMREKGILNMNSPAPYTLRAKVPGGWFVCTDRLTAGGTFFYPDPEHTWDGSSLP